MESLPIGWSSTIQIPGSPPWPAESNPWEKDQAPSEACGPSMMWPLLTSSSTLQVGSDAGSFLQVPWGLFPPRPCTSYASLTSPRSIPDTPVWHRGLLLGSLSTSHPPWFLCLLPLPLTLGSARGRPSMWDLQSQCLAQVQDHEKYPFPRCAGQALDIYLHTT